eukprot:g14040.t1
MKVTSVQPRSRSSFRFTGAAAALWGALSSGRGPNCVRALPGQQNETAQQVQQLVSSAGAEGPNEDDGSVVSSDAGAKLQLDAEKMQIEKSPAFGFEFDGRSIRSLSEEASHSVRLTEPPTAGSTPRHYVRTEQTGRGPIAASADQGEGQREDILTTGRRTASSPPSLVPAAVSLSLLDEISSSSSRASSPATLLKNEMLTLLEKMSEAGPKTLAQFFAPAAPHLSSSDVVTADRKPAIEVAKDWLEGPGMFVRDGSAQKTETERNKQKRYPAEAGGSGTAGAKGEGEPSPRFLTSADPTAFARSVRISVSLHPDEESMATPRGNGETASAPAGGGPLMLKKLAYSCRTSISTSKSTGGRRFGRNVCSSVEVSECDNTGEHQGGTWTSCKPAEGRGAEGLVLKEIRCPPPRFPFPKEHGDKAVVNVVDMETPASYHVEPTAACVHRTAAEALVGLLLSQAPGTSGRAVGDCVVKLHRIVALEDDHGEDAHHLRSFRFLLLMEKVLPLSGFANWQKPTAHERAKRFADIHRRTMTCWRQLASFGLVHNDLKTDNLGFEVGSSGVGLGEELPYKSSVKWFDFGGATIVDVLDVPLRGADGADGGKERLMGKKLPPIPFRVILTTMPHNFRKPHFYGHRGGASSSSADTERIELETDLAPRRSEAHAEVEQPTQPEDDAEHSTQANSSTTATSRQHLLLQRQFVPYGGTKSPAGAACAPLANFDDKELRAWYLWGGNGTRAGASTTARLATMHGPKTDLYALALALGQFLFPLGDLRDPMTLARHLWEPLHREVIESLRRKMDPASCGVCPHPKWVTTVETLKRNYFCAAASKLNRTTPGPMSLMEEDHGFYHDDEGAATRVRAGAIVAAAKDTALQLQLLEPESESVAAQEFIRAAAAIEQHLLCAATPQLDTSDGLYERETLLTCQRLCTSDVDERLILSGPGSCGV